MAKRNMEETITITVKRYMELHLNHGITKVIDRKATKDAGATDEMDSRAYGNWCNDAVGGSGLTMEDRVKKVETRIKGIEAGKVVGGGKESDPMLKGLRTYCASARGAKVHETAKWTYNVVRTYLGKEDYREVVESYSKPPFNYEVTPECEKELNR